MSALYNSNSMTLSTATVPTPGSGTFSCSPYRPLSPPALIAVTFYNLLQFARGTSSLVFPSTDHNCDSICSLNIL